MVIGTSAIVDTELDGAVGMNSGIFNNPFLIWGRYRRGLFRTTLPLSFQFHHTQMDGAHAGRFLQRLQEGILALEKPAAGAGTGGACRPTAGQRRFCSWWVLAIRGGRRRRTSPSACASGSALPSR